MRKKAVSTERLRTKETRSSLRRRRDSLDNTPDHRLPPDLDVKCAVEGESGDDGEGEGRNNVDLLVEVLEGDGREGTFLGQDLANVVVVGKIVDGGRLAFGIVGVVVRF